MRRLAAPAGHAHAQVATAAIASNLRRRDRGTAVLAEAPRASMLPPGPRTSAHAAALARLRPPRLESYIAASARAIAAACGSPGAMAEMPMLAVVPAVPSRTGTHRF